MSALLLVVLCIAAGALVARAPHPAGMVPALNWWVINVALPALVLVRVVALDWSLDLVWPAVAMWPVFFGAWLVIAVIGRALGWRRGEIGALVLTCGLGNTSFVGYPLIEALRGPEALGVAVVADQLGTFLLLSTFGLLVAACMSVGLGWKMVLAPLTVWALLSMQGQSGDVLDITVLQAATAPMITAGILAQQYGLAPQLANRIVGVGIMLSLLTVPFVSWLL